MGRGWLEFLVFGADGARNGEAVRSRASLPLSWNKQNEFQSVYKKDAHESVMILYSVQQK